MAIKIQNSFLDAGEVGIHAPGTQVEVHGTIIRSKGDGVIVGDYSSVSESSINAKKRAVVLEVERAGSNVKIEIDPERVATAIEVKSDGKISADFTKKVLLELENGDVMGRPSDRLRADALERGINLSAALATIQTYLGSIVAGFPSL